MLDHRANTPRAALFAAAQGLQRVGCFAKPAV
jgi:hypothetical protein